MKERQLVHEISGRELDHHGFATRVVCGLLIKDDTSAVWYDDADPRHGLPKADKFSPAGYRWCLRCQRSAR